MPDKCIAPGCSTNKENKVLAKEDRISVFHFPKENDQTRELRKRWINAVPREDWKPSEYSRLCEKHFTESDFKKRRTDTNSTRKKLHEVDLLRKELTENAVPTQWPGCPALLSKKIPTPRPTSLASSATREEKEQIRGQISLNISIRMEEERKLIEIEEDAFQSLEEFDQKIVTRLPENIFQLKENGYTMLFAVASNGTPTLKYCMKVFSSLEFELWCCEEKITIDDIGKSELSSTLRDCSQVIDILNCLSQKYDMKVENGVSDEEFITNIIDQLEEKFTGNRKVEFLAEQLSMVFTKSNGRRYSPSLLAMSSLWEITSPALYKQICGEDVLTLPHYKYLRSLTSALGRDLKLSEPAKAYLKARCSKLSTEGKCVSLIMDEVYVHKSVQYANGQFYGLENNEATKTLLCVMVKSISGKYRDIVSMSPITNINHGKSRVGKH